MRTTLNLNDDLLTRAKAEAVRQRTTLTRLIERGLGLVLDPPPEPEPSREPFRIRVFGDPNARMELAEYERRVAEAEDEYDRRQAGLLPLADSGSDV